MSGKVISTLFKAQARAATAIALSAGIVTMISCKDLRAVTNSVQASCGYPPRTSRKCAR